MDEVRVLNNNISKITEIEEPQSYKLIVELAQDAIFIKDLESRYVLVNQKTPEAFGNLSREEVISKNDYELLPPDQAKVNIEDDKKVFKTGKPIEITKRMTAGDKEFWFQTLKTPLKDAQGNVIGLIGIVRDITERKKAEEKLRESKEFMESLIASMKDGLSILDSQSVHMDVNMALCRMTGFTREELIGTGPPHLYWPEEEYENIEKAFQKTLRREFKDFELIFKRKNGERFPVIVSPSCLKDNNGNVISYYATVKNITERKKAEEKFKQEKKKTEDLLVKLEDAYNELRLTQDEFLRREKLVTTGTLVAGVAHEIRNPLAIIGMTVQYLQSKLNDKDPKKELTEAIIEKVEKLDRVTKELTSYGRAVNLNTRKYSLAKCLNMNLALIKPKCRVQKITIRKEYSKLPLIEMDEEQMDKVFLNIMDNAIEAMPKGGVVTVTTDLDEKANMAIIKIHNTGSEIEKKHLPHIFKPFYTFDKNKGAGLGLAIAQTAVLRHGGKIELKSQSSGENKGVTFIIRLPISVAPLLKAKEDEIRKIIENKYGKNIT